MNVLLPAPNVHQSICLLELLPVELLLKILALLSDLLSLDSLLRASPVIHRAFGNYAVEVTDTILSNGSTCGHVQVIIRVIAHIRSSTLPIQSLKELESRVITEALRFRYHKSEIGFVPDHLPRDTTTAVIRSLLATTRRVAWFSFDCIEFYLNRFKALRPDRLADKNYRYRPRHDTNKPPPRSRKVEVRDIGSPTWVEEQRVTRVLWRLQLICDVKTAAQASLLSWPQIDIEEISRRDLMDFYRTKSPWVPYNDFPYYEPRIQLQPEYQEMLSVTTYLEEVHGEQWPTQAVTPLQVKRIWPLPRPRERDWRHLEFMSTACSFYTSVFEKDVLARCWPHRSIKWEAYRRLGFALWSPERLWAYGFQVRMGPREGPQFRVQTAYYMWQSVIARDDDDE